ncbi:bifunctional phosphopantothenoylcysteine decarboxylase/phosphopantothenate synthase [Arthrobacter sp. UM1]|uniref:bifunctional phosphopantothenoylcysteine decarboxylase/phosphopantothenate synthase n=1 Tax=Arthrobacter sp. UM1 TaxID=2766776 RepID=UPI001CF619E6|nr:bifunctional phosphopantothenoylcysteine decarboxylase/phosphopantothenate synthase [Arthrobacter sp. UM1]MCB4207565.1 bifunctional phosphopantothenoylcysteine decarboxylase/phosphopantothenate synthase [Arthrobacter sp. UM1]
MKIVLGVGGGIAAYKSALLLRLFTEAGHDVRVIPTRASLNFVGAATWEALSHHPVSHDVFDAVDEVQHVRVGQEADLVVIAPATADLMARIAAGRADDLLTSTVLATRAPVVLAPAMHTEMWENPATRANVETLRGRGIAVIEPAVGRLTGTDTGAGRLPDPEAIRDAALAAASEDLDPEPGEGSAAADGTGAPLADRNTPWTGRSVVVTLGGTREPLDPVRYLGNRSSGKQGLAFARALAEQGAEVTVVAGAVEIPLDESLRTLRIGTARELEETLERLVRKERPDAIVMAAAVADFRPARTEASKIKKRDGEDAPQIVLERNPDVIAGLAEARGEGRSPLLVAFAAETGDEHGSVLEYAESKLRRKRVDALCVNEVGLAKGFGADENELTVLFADGADPVHASGPKDEVARAAVTALGRLVSADGAPAPLS